VPRLVGAYDIGRVVNPKIAHSQCIGGMVGGIGMALLEQADWDPRFGRVMNANLAEYLVPVNADIGILDAVFVPSDDRAFNPIGAKGVAELGLCGVAPAIANAVYHATGKRVRDLPILPEALLA
jgi:xanthine dehydrogenase YagR molybdenum-binding subunit